MVLKSGLDVFSGCETLYIFEIIILSNEFFWLAPNIKKFSLAIENSMIEDARERVLILVLQHTWPKNKRDGQNSEDFLWQILNIFVTLRCIW